MSADSSLRSSLQALGVTRLTPRLVGMSTWSFISGLAQAGVLVILSGSAVARVGGHGPIKFGSHTLSASAALSLAAALVIVYLVTGIMSARVSGHLFGYVVRAGRNTIIDRFFAASWSVQSDERLGEVQQMLTINAMQLGGMAQVLASGLQAVFNVVALLFVAFAISPLSAIGVLLIGVVLYVFLRPFNKATGRSSRQQSQLGRIMSNTVTSYTRMAREFRLLGITTQATSKLHELNDSVVDAAERTRVLLGVLPVVYSAVTLFLVVVGLDILSHVGSHSLAAIGAVLLILLRSLTYGSQIQTSSQQFASFRAFIVDLEDKVHQYEVDAYRDGLVENPEKLDIACRSVSYSYDGARDVLEDVSLTIGAGAVVGIVGHSGSGKSTLAQLLLGMRKPTSGELLVGGVPPTDLSLERGPSPLALVAQEPVLLDGTIAFNVALFRPVDRIEIEAACRAAHIHDDILALPKGYDTEVGEGGTGLSGGQRQRLAIARALIGAPLLLVLDEPTSALDGRSERLFRETLAGLRGQMTVAIISHRLSTIGACDELVVLESGHLIASGPREVVCETEAFKSVMDTLDAGAELP
jgi:ABC-type multidrug transport system fused ATPase/permease subunit